MHKNVDKKLQFFKQDNFSAKSLKSQNILQNIEETIMKSNKNHLSKLSIESISLPDIPVIEGKTQKIATTKLHVRFQNRGRFLI